MKRQDWNARYSAEDLVWGTEPNRFVAEQLRDLPPRGRALDIACGEGRNAIWLAKLGWKVTAVDFSDVAIERSRRLATEQRVEVDWINNDVTHCDLAAAAFQLVLIAYLQVPPDEFHTVLERAARWLAPGGTLFMVGHARRNLSEGVGGPRQPDVLWEPEELRQELLAAGLTVRRCEHVRRPVETPDGVRDAIDTLALAERPVR
jgi:2-polyprenyl-3-methyl-5-hydroxy-6-metoxy-1,4-benzoquinol methylase